MKPFAKNFFFHAFTWYFILFNTSFIYCPSLYGKFLNVIHEYVCSLIILLGPLYGYYRANLLLIIATVAGWLITGRCFITVMTNKTCNHDESTPFENCSFHTKRILAIFTGNDKFLLDHHLSETVDYILLFFVVSYNLYMIWKDVCLKRYIP